MSGRILTVSEAAKVLKVPDHIVRQRLDALAPNQPRLGAQGYRLIDQETIQRLSDHLRDKPYKPMK